jgi:hypothetical protein
MVKRKKTALIPTRISNYFVQYTSLKRENALYIYIQKLAYTKRERQEWA